MPRVVPNLDRNADADGSDGRDGASTSASNYELVPPLLGFLLAHIVELSHYSGSIRGRETAELVREPLNPVASDAIKVVDARGVQVGYVDGETAAALAPLIDSRLAAIKLTVPAPPRSTNPFRVASQIHIFDRAAAVGAVAHAISSNGLHIISHSDPEWDHSAFVAAQEAAENPDLESVSIDVVCAFMNHLKPQIEPLEPPKTVITTELFEHQKEGLGWLVQQENSTRLPPFWTEKDDGFLNVFTKNLTDERPEPLKGGIFADDMGLGKTLTLLSLIAVNGPKPEQRASGSRSKRKADGNMVEDEVSGPKATLIVCPKSVLTVWTTQLEEHTRPGSLSVHIYHRNQDPEELSRHDIVLTTYNVLSAEFGKDDSPLVRVYWLRVILDEALVIKTFTANQTKVAIALKAVRRWVVTGTPIQNTTVDLFSLMAFLRYQPFSNRSWWRNLVQLPLENGYTRALARLHNLLGTIALRRTKNAEKGSKTLPGLPPKTVETCFVELSPEEREYYDQMESEAQNILRVYVSEDTMVRNYSSVLHTMLRLRQICNDVLLCPSHINALISSNAIEGGVFLVPSIY